MISNLLTLFAIAVVAAAVIGGPVLVMKMAEFSHNRSENHHKKKKNDSA